VSALNSAMLLALLPELLVLALMGLVLITDLSGRVRGRNLGWLTIVGLVAVVLISVSTVMPDAAGEAVWGGTLKHDALSFVFRMLFLIAAALTVFFVLDVPGLGDRGAFYLLLLASVLGMMLMAMANDIIMLFLAMETATIPLYVLAGFFTGRRESVEAGFKYLLFGALASGVMLYGLSLLYGFSGGEVEFAALAQGLAETQAPTWAVLAALMVVLAGFAFKVAAVPFHFWAPDVYQGAPTPIAAFLSTASKAAGFVLLVRVALVAFPSATLPWWGAALAAMAAATMTLGNVLALTQTDLKRLLAYSSIGHAGYILMGVVAATKLGLTAVVFYLLVYMLTNLAAFGIVAVLERSTGSSAAAHLAGLYKRSPWLTLATLAAFLSLAGVPPFAGFVAKVWVFMAAVEAKLEWLAVIAVLNSIVGIYYYLVVLKVAYEYDPPADAAPIVVSRPVVWALAVLAVFIVVAGVAFGPWFGWGQWAAAALFP